MIVGSSPSASSYYCKYAQHQWRS
uniref:Uncharacterized protein n=1 Tax=Oryza glumipatula TaxID=40148 RepID=A0A0D9ZHX8_9ORYZ